MYKESKFCFMKIAQQVIPEKANTLSDTEINMS